MALRVAELEALFTANTDQLDKAETKVKAIGKKVEANPIPVKADAKDALARMGEVESEAQKLLKAKTVVTLEANIDRAEKNFMRVYERLDYLKSVRTELDVEADIKRAEAGLSKAQRMLDGLRSARATIEVDADTQAAVKELQDVKGVAAKAGQDAGEQGGRSLSESMDAATRGVGGKVGAAIGGDLGDELKSALIAIPVAGGILLAAAAIGNAITDAINEGMQIEVGYDRLQALTGISESDALRLGRAAGEAYANNFGDSIEANMDTTRLALQFHLIDADTTTRDAQQVVEGLAGIADVLEEDVKPTATAVTTLMRSGLAKSAKEAYDVLAAGAREGLNRNDDLLDTMTEYPVVLAKLGLSAKDMLGLLNQGLVAGARNTDVVADALKEFQIRATDASVSSKAGFEAIGLNAEEMTAKIAAGGEGAREGLQQVLDGLRAMEDPVTRNAAAVALFGTKAEDLGDALFALDTSNAVDNIGQVTGAAQKMFDTLSDNDASRMERAQRNIDVAMQAIQGSLAQAFSEPLADIADFVSQNRGPVLQFFLDLANGALDFGDSMVEGVASSTEAVGEFVSGPLAELVDGLAGFIDFFNGAEARPKELDDLATGMRAFDDATKASADHMRDLGHGAIDDARQRLNEFGQGAVNLGYLNDASLRLADSISVVGYASDGVKLSLEGMDLAHLSATDSGAQLERQIQSSVTAMKDELAAAAEAGEGQDQLAARYKTSEDALLMQLRAMGLTDEQARTLIGTYGAVPGMVDTTVRAHTEAASAAVRQFVYDLNNIPGQRDVIINQVFRQTGADRGQVGAAYNARGNLLEFMAAGGLPGLTPMSNDLARIVPANTWRVVGDRGDVPELYAPLDNSARSWSLIAQGIQSMLGGGVTTSRERAGSVVNVYQQGTYLGLDERALHAEGVEVWRRALDAAGL